MINPNMVDVRIIIKLLRSHGLDMAAELIEEQHRDAWAQLTLKSMKKAFENTQNASDLFPTRMRVR